MIHLRLRIVFDLSLIDVALHGLSVIHLSLHIWRRIEHQEVLVINICDKKLVHNAAQEGGKARAAEVMVAAAATAARARAMLVVRTFFSSSPFCQLVMKINEPRRQQAPQ